MSNFQFPATERLKSKKIIGSLFQKEIAKSFGAYPLRLVWVSNNDSSQDTPSIQAAFAVPKKSFRRANVRNTIRRRVREAYRLHKHLIFNALKDKNNKFAFMWLYTGKEEMTYQEIEKAMTFAIHRFLKEINTSA